jgi:ferritin-like metal-binding protein YciE
MKAKIENLKDAYLFGIQDMNEGCGKAMDGMEAMRAAATHPDLKTMMEGAIGSMHHALEIFDIILKRHGVTPDKSHQNKALTALGIEGKEQTVDIDYADARIRDAMIIAKVRNVAHYPHSGFQAFVAQAKALGFDEDVDTLLSGGAPEDGQISNEDAFAMMAHLEAELLFAQDLPKVA